MTFTGQSGVSFDRAGRISMHEVLQRIEETTGGLLRAGGLRAVALRASALLPDRLPAAGPGGRAAGPVHALHRAGGVLRLPVRPAVPRAVARGSRRPCATRSIGCGPRPTAIPRRPARCAALDQLLRRMFPSDRSLSRAEALRVGERAVKAVYVHSHMDEETFDVERVAQCCDSNCYPDGGTIPVCNYNVLYREKEHQFMHAPRTWNERTRRAAAAAPLAADRDHMTGAHGPPGRQALPGHRRVARAGAGDGPGVRPRRGRGSPSPSTGTRPTPTRPGRGCRGDAAPGGPASRWSSRARWPTPRTPRRW